jgi:hypothetical protein
MMSRGQQILIKRAQREAGLSDGDYREALQTVSHCTSTKDVRMTDRHVDLVLAYFEAIYWRKVNSGELQTPCKPNAVFAQRGYWAAKNPRSETSRDRFAAASVSRSIEALEREIAGLGFGSNYCAAIRAKATNGASDIRSLYQYKVALERTLRAKKKFTAGHAVNNQSLAESG